MAKYTLKKLFKELDFYYGIKFDLDQQAVYEIIDDMNNIESRFNKIREKLKTYKEK
jgi:hypothetical protein